MAPPFLAIQSVTKRFAGPTGMPIEVLRPMSLEIARGEFVVFLGPSGCGKTTLMRMVGGLDQPSDGAIRLEGHIVRKPDRRRGMVFQSYSSFPWLTVGQNVAFGLRYRDDLGPDEKVKRTRNYLALVGLVEFADAWPSRISGGMRQRVAIARSLVTEPDLLLLDEPFTGLDDASAAALARRFASLKQAGCIVIVATHDLDVAEGLFDRAIFLRDGRMLDLIDQPGALRSTYRDVMGRT
jgi:NitT/TauT family transport system ATP-binding protein